MKVKYFLAMSTMAAALGCSPSQKDSYDSFDEYPVYQGKWEEMEYDPSSTRFALWAPTAQEVRVMLYKEAQGGSGVWGERHVARSCRRRLLRILLYI